MSQVVPPEIERKADEICHNNQSIEEAWATKCFAYAEEHEKLLRSTPRNCMIDLSGYLIIVTHFFLERMRNCTKSFGFAFLIWIAVY